MLNHPRHLSDRTLLAAVDNELGEDGRAALDEHLARCRECEARLARMEAAAAGARRAFRHEHTGPDAHFEAARGRLIAAMSEASGKHAQPWRLLAFMTSAVAVAAAVALLIQPRAGSSADSQGASLEASALPIASVTPGAARPMSRTEICNGGEVREPIPAATRTAVLREYRMIDVPADQYELDYLITPELGGTADRENLWPERYASRVWNAGVKDGLEDLLPELVCKGAVDLATAQHDIASDWIAAYKKYFHSDHPIAGLANRASPNDGDMGPGPRPILISARIAFR